MSAAAIFAIASVHYDGLLEFLFFLDHGVATHRCDAALVLFSYSSTHAHTHREREKTLGEQPNHRAKRKTACEMRWSVVVCVLPVP